MLSTVALWFLAAGYSIIVAFFIIQRLLRRTKDAKSFKRGVYDRGNMILIGGATGIGILVPVVVDVLGVGIFAMSIAAGFVALLVMLLGVGTRIWAAVTLGNYYTTTLMVAEGQRVVTKGPYAWVRHPGYLGEVLIWTGLGVLSSSLIVALWLPIMFVVVILYRISSEERMLVKELGDDYVKYQRKTRKLVPFVY
ncbi:MAG TPA: isoprenylcysteine carboxylmethyltransferase family protein [Nitrososphaerales archaeon]|nr:isoprenylcysteine carboxylmethyltransferase family protein [Nitrososphaerales archaeon]